MGNADQRNISSTSALRWNLEPKPQNTCKNEARSALAVVALQLHRSQLVFKAAAKRCHAFYGKTASGSGPEHAYDLLCIQPGHARSW